ncbi:Mitochondrial inner membrane protein oxa1 [Varicellaria rhodocarpa]|nr:Mitochondrial inner membrane protein oxa1 [Varicellaria rhodocarpa]
MAKDGCSQRLGLADIIALSKALLTSTPSDLYVYETESIAVRRGMFVTIAALATLEATAVHLSEIKLSMSVPTDTFNTIPFDGLSSTDQLPIAEKVGYLKELGIDYGWGVTSSIQWLLEHVHVYSGSPWWASIALTAIVVRLGVFPLYVTAMDTSGRLSAIQPQMVPLQQRINLAKQSQDQTTMLTAIAEMRGLFRTNNIKFRNMFWPLLRGGEIGTQSTMTTPMRTLFQYFLPAMSTLITLFMPGALQVTFATTSLASLIQTSLFRQPWFRSTLGISKYIPPTPPAAPQTRYPGTMSVYQPPSPVESTESEKKGVVGGAISEIKGAAKQVMSSARRSVEQRQGAKAGGRLTAAELRRAKEYEERRKQELEFEKERGRVSGRRRSNRNVR